MTTIKNLICPAVALLAFACFAVSPAVGGFTPAMAGAFTFTTIDVPGATTTAALGVNARGQIVGGYIDTSGAEHGFVLYRGTFTTIDVPGANGTEASGINSAGQIVGLYFDASGEHGFVLYRGTFTTIDVPGATFTEANGNNARQIVGGYGDTSGAEHGFVVVP